MGEETDPELALLYEAVHAAHPKRLTSILCKLLEKSSEYVGPLQEELLLRSETHFPERIDRWELYNGEPDYGKVGFQKEENAHEENDSHDELDEERTLSKRSNCERDNTGDADSDNGDDSDEKRDDHHSKADVMEPDLSEAEPTNSTTGASLPLKRKRPMYSRQRYEICANCEEEYDVTLNRNHSCRYHAGQCQ
ncbi:hypothetical protein N0V95_009867 [Ascochyta clinopodiicola]|nr:hypothetical protein N0V95_009867 [Ascochyta clinopodiicola]